MRSQFRQLFQLVRALVAEFGFTIEQAALAGFFH